MLPTLERRPLMLLLALGVGACSGAGWGRPDYGAVFDQVVFGGASGAPDHNRVYHWGGPILLAVRGAAGGEVGASRAALVGEALSELRALTGVDMAPAGGGADRRFPRRALRGGLLLVDLLGARRAPRPRRLNHEMAHLLGLTYHPAEAYSVLDDHPASDRYSPTDTMLVRRLYAPDLSPGRPRAEALAALAGRVSVLSR